MVLYRGLFRVWAQLQREFVQKWQSERCVHPVFACSRGRRVTRCGARPPGHTPHLTLISHADISASTRSVR